MNKEAVKELTKEGCIVGKEAAESITEDDVERIKSLDTLPMYISEQMIDNLRNKAVEEQEIDTGTGQKLVKKQEVVDSEPSEGPTGINEDDNIDTNEAQDVERPEPEVPEKEPEAEEPEETESEEPEVDDSEDTHPEDDLEEERDRELENNDIEDDEDTPETAGSKFSHDKTVTITDNRRRHELQTKVEILEEAQISRDEKDVPEFLHNYNDRYDRMKKLLMRRRELRSAISLKRLTSRDKGQEVAAIGMVNDKYSTNSGKWIVEIEDKTGTFKLLVGEREGEMIVPDEILGVKGSMGGDIIYVDNVIRPDLPIPNGVNTTKQNVSAAYISDLHLGSIDTLHDRFDRFGQWLNTDAAKDIGYLVITGDIVEGVGIYPNQDKELEVTDIYKQYELFEEWVEKIPEDIQVLIGPGNHDIVRLAEPQPRLPGKVFPNIKDFNNVHLVQNPQRVRLHGIESKGLKHLMYHGYSFDDHVDQIQQLRKKAYDKPEHVMIDLLKRRHLGPTFGSTLLSPEDKDYLVIEDVPDVMVSGHFHSHANETYKGTNVICSSSFQAQTDFQRRVGHVPDPGKVTLMNFKTRKTQVKQF